MSQHDDEDEDRRAILRRKALFIASAMSGMALLDGCSRPQPCLSMVPIPRPDVTAPDAPAPDATAVMMPEAGMPEPIPCLSVALPEEPPPDAAIPTPMPCLSIAAPPRTRRPRPSREATPQPCLRVAPDPSSQLVFKPDEED